jgi:dTDP-4-dehydrorhamnose 3,5-epimerase-like enzyme
MKEINMLVETMKPDFKFSNEVGQLVQLVHEGWKQVNVIHSKKESIRGGHFHKENREAFYIISGRLQLELSCNNVKEEYEFGPEDMFIISPFQLHSFRFLEDTVMVSMYNLGVELENGNKDIYTEA